MQIAKELQIMKDHWYFRLIKRARPWAIHTECLHKANVWQAAKMYVDSGMNAIWFVLTPANYEFVKAESGVNTSRKTWERILLERYKWLRDHGQEIQLHVHLRIKMDLYTSGAELDKDVKNKISDSVKWMKTKGFDVNKIVFGWWSYNRHAAAIAESHGLRVINRLDYYFIHDYDLLSLKLI